MGINGGSYGFEYTYADAGCGGPCGPYGTTEDSDTVYGLSVGMNLVAAAFFADVGVEYAQYKEADDFYRSDAMLTLGAFLGEHFQIFGGYRRGTFGDGFFSSDIPAGGGAANVFAHTEYGPFLGGGVGFQLGKKASLAMTLAYNVLTYETPSGTQLDDVDYGGFSAKVQLGLPGNVQTYVRWQLFEADQTQAGYSEDLTTDYFVLGVQKGFTFANW